MSIATAITNLQGKIANAYTAIQEKGGTLPATQDAENLSATIVDLPAGSSSKWGMTLDEVCTIKESTGNYYGHLKPFLGVSGNVTFTGITGIRPYALMFGGSSDRIMPASPVKSVSFPDLTEGDLATSFLGCSCLTATSFPSLLSGNFNSTFVSCTSLTGVSFPNLSSGNFNSAFVSCTNLSSISFPKLSGNTLPGAFMSCTSLTTASFPGISILSTSSGMFLSTFNDCTSLTSVSFPNLLSVYQLGSATTKSMFQHCFNNCPNLSVVEFPELTNLNTSYHGAFVSAFATGCGLTSIVFPKLSSIQGLSASNRRATFEGCTSLVRIDLPKLVKIVQSDSATTNNLTKVFNGCTNLTEIHFGAENQAIIEASDGYATKWNAPNANCQIYFDL